MRGIFSLIGLAVACLIVGLLISKQLGGSSEAPPANTATASAAGVSAPNNTQQMLETKKQMEQQIQAAQAVQNQQASQADAF